MAQPLGRCSTDGILEDILRNLEHVLGNMQPYEKTSPESEDTWVDMEIFHLKTAIYHVHKAKACQPGMEIPD